MIDDRYDRWKCARCGLTVWRRAVPHDPPECCDTGMWWEETSTGPPYEVSPGETS